MNQWGCFTRLEPAHVCRHFAVFFEGVAIQYFKFNINGLIERHLLDGFSGGSPIFVQRGEAMGFKHQVQQICDTPSEAIERLVRVPMERPSILQADEVLVEIRAAGLSWVDMMMMCGVYQHRPQLPYTPGMEYSGVVVDAGSRALQIFSIGDRVLSDGFAVGPRSSSAHQHYGGFASCAVAPASALMPLPPQLSFAQGCNLLGNYETAHHALVHCAELKAGDTVLINGATGATGLAAVHLAKILGATVIATGRSAEKLSVVRDQGADFVLKLERDEEGGYRFKNQVRSCLGGRGVDAVYDGVGGGVIEHSLRSLRFGGTYVVVGWASTPFVSKKKEGPKTNQIPSNLVLMKGLKVMGSPAVISAQKLPHLRAKRHEDLFRWIKDGKLLPHCHRVYASSQLKEALLAKWNGAIVGGVAIQMSESS